MKKLSVLVAPLACLFLLSGCGGIKTTEEFAHEVNDLAAVLMTVEESDPDSAVYTIDNDSEQNIRYGYDYGVQVKKDEVWYDIQHRAVPVETVQLELESGRQETYSCSWKEAYGTLPKGRYRIVKSVTCQGIAHWLAAEFIVE